MFRLYFQRKIYEKAEADALRTSNGVVMKVNVTMFELQKMDETFRKAIAANKAFDGSSLADVESKRTTATMEKLKLEKKVEKLVKKMNEMDVTIEDRRKR